MKTYELILSLLAAFFGGLFMESWLGEAPKTKQTQILYFLLWMAFLALYLFISSLDQ